MKIERMLQVFIDWYSILMEKITTKGEKHVCFISFSFLIFFFLGGLKLLLIKKNCYCNRNYKCRMSFNLLYEGKWVKHDTWWKCKMRYFFRFFFLQLKHVSYIIERGYDYKACNIAKELFKKSCLQWIKNHKMLKIMLYLMKLQYSWMNDLQHVHCTVHYLKSA